MNVQTVVVGVDGSACALRALDAATALVEPGGSIHVVSAYDAPSNTRVAQAYAVAPEEFKVNVDVLAEERDILETATKSIEDHGVIAVGHLVDGDPASAILDTAEEFDADLIVVGSRGLSRAAQMVRGSVSTKVAHHSPIDFMVVH